jgi:predicted nuclease of predicted toxin-antitoxin system
MMQEAPDQVVFQAALDEDRVLVSADTDFGALLIPGRFTRPSLILFRHGSPRRPAEQGAVIVHNLPQIAEDLQAAQSWCFGAARSESEDFRRNSDVRSAG